MINGHLDRADHTGVGGWVWDTENPDRRIELDVFDGEDRIARIVAEDLRADLVNAGIGDGHHGFSLRFPPDLLPLTVHRISVRVADTGHHIRNSPKLVYPPHGGTFESFAAWFNGRIEDMAAAALEPSQLQPLFALCTTALSRLMTAEQQLLEQKSLGPEGQPDTEKLPQRLKFVLERALQRLKPIHVPQFRTPKTSIIISAAPGLEETYTLLRSIIASERLRDYEIILADGGGGTDLIVLPFLVKGGGIRIIKSPRQLTDFQAYNLALPMARGDEVVFLGRIASVAPGAISALSDTLALVEGKGIVGARLIAADGRIVEAGAHFEILGNRYPIARYDGKDVPRHRVLRAVDDISPRAFAIRRALLRETGDFVGVEELADLGMTDLCLRLREKGQKVLVQGMADAVIGEDGPETVLRGLARMTFVRRWQHLGDARTRKSVAQRGRRALVIDEVWPDTARDAASVAIVSHCESLGRLGYEVEFAATHAVATPEQAYGLYLRGIIPAVGQPDVPAFLATREQQFEVVYIHRFNTARQVMEAVRASQPAAQVLFNVADLHFLRLSRQAAVEGKQTLDAEIEAIREAEVACMRAADTVITHSSAELPMIEPLLAPPSRAVRVLWNHRVASKVPGWAERSGATFIGSYLHAPNIDAVHHTCATLWPALRQAMPDFTLEIAGAQIEKARFGALPEGVVLRGHVSDIVTYLADKRLMLAPLRFGAGVKGKILLALSQGVPCIMTPIGAEGMDLPENLREILLAEDDTAFIRQVARLETDAELWTKASQLGLAYAAEMLSDAAIDAQLRTALERGITSRGETTSGEQSKDTETASLDEQPASEAGFEAAGVAAN